MSAEVETMFYTREEPQHRLGTRMEDAPGSREALELTGLDRQAIQRPIATTDGQAISGFKANIRGTDSQALGMVTDRYKVVQNEDAFAFTDQLLGESIAYEAAGSLQNGRYTWLLAKLPQWYIISGDEITPYMVFMDTYDGTGAIRAAMTPIRVVCVNTLNLALSTTKRSWPTNHTGDIAGKIEDAHYTLLRADRYMSELGKAVDHMRRLRLSERRVMGYIDALFPLYDNPTLQQQRDLSRMKEDIKTRYFDTPDLKHVGRNGYRFIDAVSDSATHTRSLRGSANHRENLFAKAVEGNALIDGAFTMLQTT